MARYGFRPEVAVVGGELGAGCCGAEVVGCKIGLIIYVEGNYVQLFFFP